jgi:hypothetical protein
MSVLHEYFKGISGQSSNTLKSELSTGSNGKRKKSMLNGSSSDMMRLKQLLSEVFRLPSGIAMKITRFYVDSPKYSEYSTVGWILQEGVTHCMVCSTQFNPLEIKHNCSACGLIACKTCVSKTAYIKELGEERKFRICNSCFDDHVSLMYCL